MCVQFSKEYLPFVLGALTQLCQPTAWDVADAAAMADVLGNMQELLIMFGTVADCTPCAPTIVPPEGVTSAQQACNLSGYLAHMVIRKAMEEAISAIQNDLDVLNWGVLIIGLIPGAGIVVNALIGGLKSLYSAMVGGTLADYQDAVTDDALWGEVTCAIYNAIATDGQVTCDNFPTILTNVSAITYTHSEVVTQIHDFLSNIGCNGVMNLQQPGVMASYDCSGCGGGTSTGPQGLNPLFDAGRVSIEILSGDAIGQAAVTFDHPFTVAPIVVVGTDEQDWIASADVITTTGFLATLKSATSLDSPITADLFWHALLPGTP